MRKPTAAGIFLGVALAAAACDKASQDGVQRISHETTTIGDKDVLAPAIAAGNEVILNAGDCAKVVKAAPAAKAAIAEASGKVQSAAGKMTVESLQKQVAAIADACPAGVD
jgi:hypothetical protein